MGGKKFFTSKSTLLSVDSIFCHMLSDKWLAPVLDVDSNMRVYHIDRKPELFEIILKFIRNKGKIHIEALP